MLILPAKDQVQQYFLKMKQAKEGLRNHFNKELERILSENSGRTEKYWILGKVKFDKDNSKVGKTFLQASDAKPPVVKDAFLYEVDNSNGTKTLLWVCYPNGNLRLPTINKTISIGSPPKNGVSDQLGMLKI